MKDLIKAVALEVAEKFFDPEMDADHAAQYVEACIAELSKRAEAVAWWSFGINGTWDGFTRKRPDDDVYDEGTLTKLFTFPPIHDIEAIENRVAEACAWAVEHESQDSSRYDFAFAIRSGDWRNYK